jgi:ADP-L-glycero-D-manno-heptose 6-epimerase
MIIVTGAAGFIGSNLVADLNALGNTDLILVDELGHESKWKNIAKRRFDDIVPPDELPALLGKLPGCECVYHLGANSSTTAVDGDAVWRSNFRASRTLWEWCSSTRTPLIYASSAATYGDGARGFDDDQSSAALDQLRPLNLYGWSKHAFDKWAVARDAAGHAPPHWCGLKFFNVYGPNESHKGEMRSLVSKNTPRVVAGESIQLFKSYREGFADGEQLRDFIYVKDCTRVMLWLGAASGVNGIFNLGTGQARSFLDLVHAIGKALDRRVKFEFVDMPEAIRPNYQYFTQARMGKLIEAGYQTAFHSLEEGVADYVLGYLVKPDIYR